MWFQLHGYGSEKFRALGTETGQPLGGINDSHRLTEFLLFQIPDQLKRVGAWKLLREVDQCPGACGIGKLAFDQRLNLLVQGEAKINFCPILGANIGETGVLAPGVLQEMNMLEKHGRHGVLKANALVSAHASGIKKVYLRSLLDCSGNIATPRGNKENDVKGLQDIEVVPEGPLLSTREESFSFQWMMNTALWEFRARPSKIQDLLSDPDAKYLVDPATRTGKDAGYTLRHHVFRFSS